MILPNYFRNILASYVNDTWPPKHVGRSRTAFDDVLDMILFVLRTGCQWRMVPSVNGCAWQTAYGHFIKWSKKSLFERAYNHLLQLYLNKYSRMRENVITDCSFIKSIYGRDCVGPSPVDRGRKATKLSVVTDEQGVVLAATFHKGNKHDSKAFLHTITQAQHIHSAVRGKTFFADRAYDTKACDSVIERLQMTNACARRRQRKELRFPKVRNRVEHVFAWLDQFRRIIVRYDKSILQHKSFTFLALTCKILRLLGS